MTKVLFRTTKNVVVLKHCQVLHQRLSQQLILCTNTSRSTIISKNFTVPQLSLYVYEVLYLNVEEAGGGGGCFYMKNLFQLREIEHQLHPILSLLWLRAARSFYSMVQGMLRQIIVPWSSKLQTVIAMFVRCVKSQYLTNMYCRKENNFLYHMEQIKREL